MEIKWEYSAETEARRIVHTAHQMAIGFYRLNGFYILPFSPQNIDPMGNLVYLPELEYSKIPRFWDKVKRVSVQRLPVMVDDKVLKPLLTLVEEANFPKPEIDAMQEIWNKMAEEFFAAVEKVIPGAKTAFNKIIIYPTVLGTKCSFSVPEKFPSEMVLYLRNDQDMIYGLAEAILSALTRDQICKELDGSWQESEMLVDWLIAESAIGKVIGRYHDLKYFSPTLKSTRAKQGAKLFKESDEFCQKLGLSNFDKPFSIVDSQPRLLGKSLENFTSQEEAVLMKLIENENRATSIDTIGDVISISEEDFSLYAIAKTIQRIRDKLEVNGFSGAYIQTMRGKGYVLKN